MASIKTAISLLFITFILYRIFLAVRSRFYHYLAFRKYGCLPPPSLPQKDPIFGIDLILEFFRTIRDHCRMQTIQANHARYGHTFQSSPFGSRVVSTIAMRNIQAVFATDMESFGIGATRHMSTQPLLGHGIISSDGPRWKRSRGLIQPVFTRRNLESLENFEVHVNRMMERIPRNGETVDLRPLFAKLILDSSSEFIFGESVNSLLSDSPENIKFLECFNYAKSGVGVRFFLGRMRFLYRDKKFWDACKYVNDWTQKRVDRAIEHDERGERGERYVLAYELARQTTDRDALRQELLNVFFAAHDSAAIALTSIMFDLARHPAAWAKLREEVLAQLGMEAPVTFEALKGLTYLRWVVNESAFAVFPLSAFFSASSTPFP
ncbi:cytochrome P450 [Glonium stellatum]|uniref:Cytochrome P450 n=1 Tax=Glonium stellatum TaxID=574774 RepID=A0A8E2JU02_9PEZI|nr:cytochrome P450 [Glonium stellatum]